MSRHIHRATGIVRHKGCAKCNGAKWALFCRCIFNCGKPGCKGK